MSLISKNSVLAVLEESSIRLAVQSSRKTCVVRGVLKVRNASVKVEWVEREEELSIICVKVVVEGRKTDKSTERGSVHDEE